MPRNKIYIEQCKECGVERKGIKQWWSKGLCQKCYNKLRKENPPPKRKIMKICIQCGIERKEGEKGWAKGMCPKCYTIKYHPEYYKKNKERIKLNYKQQRQNEGGLSLSEASKLNWQNPEYREKTIKGQTIAQNRTEVKENTSKKSKENWQNPEFIEKQHQSRLIAQNKPERKLKNRMSRIKQIEENHGICYPSYNKTACEYFKKFDEEHNTKGRYAVYGDGEYYIKELGYWVDYINFDLKLIIEWDEIRHHYIDGKLKEKDIIRQQEIQKLYPDFEFKRIKEER